MLTNGKSISQVLQNALLGIAFLTVFSGQLYALTLDDYQRRLGNVEKSLAQLRTSDGGSVFTTNAERGMEASIRSTIPRTEKIEWPGGSIDTDNEWLHTGLDTFAAESDRSKRAVITNRLYERIQAIIQKVTDLQNATAAAQTKDGDKQKLAEILRREEYQTQKPEGESLFQRWKRQILEWLVRMFPRLSIPQESSGASSLGLILQVLLYLALAVGLGYLIYRILPFFSGRFRSRKRSSNSERVILGERIGDDQSAHDLFAEAEMLARNGELRLAIRKGYVALLCELSDRKVIGLARHKTNRDYLLDLRSRQDLLKNVSGLTSAFERHWYGTEASRDSDWDEFRDLYRSTIRGV